MADTSSRRGSAADDSVSEPPRESIDQVRDLLFGSQMRMVDSRIENLDERLRQEASALRSEFDRRLSALDETVRTEFTQHAERLNAERAKRVEDLKALSAELKESLSNLELRHQNLEKAAGNADAELRDHLMKQSALLSDQISKTSARLTGELDRITTGLQNEKLDVSALASGLTDLANRLSPSGRSQASGS